MHLQSLTLTNVRQFEHRTFHFQPGFNLLVGENGAGKTTILRGLISALADTRKLKRRKNLEDSDIRLSARLAKINAEIFHPDGKIEEFQIQKPLWELAKRSTHRKKRPLILFYSSSESICSAMNAKPIKGTRNVDTQSFHSSEEFLYAYENEFSQKTVAANERRFGNSKSVNGFVSRVLATFSSNMSDFYWRFAPNRCSLEFNEGIPDNLVGFDMFKRAESYALRWFDEESMKGERPIIWPDKKTVMLTPKSSERIGEKDLPNLYDIWKDFNGPKSFKEFLLSCSLEVELTPRIMLKRKMGTFSLNQLSDGEQRLFSLFVDIARQLSIDDPDENFGEGEAIVLIDEIDVHLHPKWQRLIVPALEDLFPNCQFIATTHSPFVIQATRRQQIISIDSTVLDGGNSIEDIAEEIQGVSVPQRSIRAEKLSAAANLYFTLLDRQAVNSQQVDSTELRAAERIYREASEPFTSDPAVHALLKVLAEGGKD